jgi:hypothetical protein
VPTNPALAAGTPCTEGGGAVCNGSGVCVACVVPANCPGVDTACAARTCDTFTCGWSFTTAGVAAGVQTPGDCHVKQCDGAGHPVDIVDDTDLPVDGLQCTSDVCTGGVSSNPAVAAGVACTQNGGNHCDGAGACVACATAGDCPATGSECLTRTCISGLCGTAPVAAGTPLAAQTSGDCQRLECDGTGGITSVADDADLPADDGNTCTNDTCASGVPAHPALAAGTACSQLGGVACDGQSTCTQPFTVLRVGDGSGTLSSAAAPIFLDTYYAVVGATPLHTTALPTTASGGNQALLIGGSTASEGGLSRSADTRYLVLAGYAIAPGGTIASATTRVVGRVDKDGLTDTSTTLASGAFANNVRAATSFDGSGFWVSGSGSASGGGVWYVGHGLTAAGAQISSTVANMRWVHATATQLYASSGSSSIGVLSIGSGLPTTSPAPAVLLQGMVATSPYGFAFLDLDATAGDETVFMCDSSSGLQKWTLSGGTWSKDASFTVPVAGCYGVTGWSTGKGATLVVTTGTSSVYRVDAPTSGTATATLLFAPATNTAHRGVALSAR